MQNGILKLDWGSVADAVLMAILVATGTALVALVQGGHFDVLSADWASIGRNMLNLGFAAAVLTLFKDFVSTSRGSLLNVTPDTNG
jgi:hypothetical protein